jgi:hypothetical protein
MPKIFISHSTEDREFVEANIVNLLHSQGLETWYSKDSIQGASRWEREIIKGLKDCTWFLVAMSPRAANSQWVKDEVDWAFANRRGKIIPVLIDDCDSDDFHLGMAGIQHLDFRGDSADARRRLLIVLGVNAAQPAPPPPAEPVQSKVPPPEPMPQDQWRNSLWTFMVRVPDEICKPAAEGEQLFVAATCVTNREYQVWVNAGGPPPRDNPKDRKKRTWTDKDFLPYMAAHPVVLVSHADAVAFCTWLTQREQKEGKIGARDYYTLPTASQWKAVAQKLPLAGDAVIDRQWMPKLLQPTESVIWGTPSPLGLHCLFGNVFEWCLDKGQRKFRTPSKDGASETKLVDCAITIGGGWASSKDWLRQEITKGTMGAIWCPNGWPMQDGGFRLWLVKHA